MASRQTVGPGRVLDQYTEGTPSWPTVGHWLCQGATRKPYATSCATPHAESQTKKWGAGPVYVTGPRNRISVEVWSRQQQKRTWGLAEIEGIGSKLPVPSNEKNTGQEDWGEAIRTITAMTLWQKLTFSYPCHKRHYQYIFFITINLTFLVFVLFLYIISTLV